MKTQTIRLLDVFIIGPWMIYAAKEISAQPSLRGQNPALAAGLFIFGVATIIYNGQNFIDKN